jgi:hypothetical protein
VRVSSDPDDPGYAEYLAGLRRGVVWDVELDGVLLKNDCVTADEERGEVVRNVRDLHGRLVIDQGFERVCGECGQVKPEKSSRSVKRETLRGTVKLVERKRAKSEA